MKKRKFHVIAIQKIAGTLWTDYAILKKPRVVKFFIKLNILLCLWLLNMLPLYMGKSLGFWDSFIASLEW